MWFAFCSLAIKPCARYQCSGSSKAAVTQQHLAELLQLAVGSTVAVARGRGGPGRDVGFQVCLEDFERPCWAGISPLLSPRSFPPPSICCCLSLPLQCRMSTSNLVKPQEFPSSGHLSISATFPSSSPHPSSFTSGLPGRERQAGGLAGRPVSFLKLDRLSRGEMGKHLCRHLAKCHGKCKLEKPLLSASPAHHCRRTA